MAARLHSARYSASTDVDNVSTEVGSGAFGLMAAYHLSSSGGYGKILALDRQIVPARVPFSCFYISRISSAEGARGIMHRYITIIRFDCVDKDDMKRE